MLNKLLLTKVRFASGDSTIGGSGGGTAAVLPFPPSQVMSSIQSRYADIRVKTPGIPMPHPTPNDVIPICSYRHNGFGPVFSNGAPEKPLRMKTKNAYQERRMLKCLVLRVTSIYRTSIRLSFFGHGTNLRCIDDASS